jgi:uncharacterized membrane protein
MKQRSLWKGFIALLGIGLLCSLIFKIAGYHHSEERSLIRGQDRVIAFHGQMMGGYHEHTEFYHIFGILPVLFVIFTVLLICLLYRRFKNHQKDSGDSTSLMRDQITPTPSHYSKANFLDEWEKNAQLEERENGNISKN